MHTMLETITLESLLPVVFSGMETTGKIRSSQLWRASSFVLRRGCRLCIQAESGSGKSSLLSFLFGIRSDYCGHILFDGVEVSTLSVEQWCELRTRTLSLLPQDMGLFAELTVAQNIDLKNNRTHHKSAAEIKDLLCRVGLAEKHDAPVGKLSIGQQQRVAFVRSVCQPFDFIFLDEPVSHLDERNNRILAAIVDEEARRQGAGVVATSVGNHLLLDNARFVSL